MRFGMTGAAGGVELLFGFARLLGFGTSFPAEADYERRVEREKQLRRRNPLIDDSLAAELEIDELYGAEEGAGD